MLVRINQFSIKNIPQPFKYLLYTVVAMVEVPDYSSLKTQWQVNCYNQNANITATNYYRPALSNPPTFLKLFNNRYNIYTDLKANLDKATSSASQLIIKQNSKLNYVILVYSYSAQCLLMAIITNALMIKVGYKQLAVAYTAKKTLNKQKLVIYKY